MSCHRAINRSGGAITESPGSATPLSDSAEFLYDSMRVTRADFSRQLERKCEILKDECASLNELLAFKNTFIMSCCERSLYRERDQRRSRWVARLVGLGVHSLRAYLRAKLVSFRAQDEAAAAWRRWHRIERREWEYYEGTLEERQIFLAGYIAGQTNDQLTVRERKP